MAGRFSRDDFWKPEVLAERARETLRDQTGNVVPEIRFGRGTVEGQSVAPQLSWSNYPVWWPLRESPASDATDEDLTGMVIEVRQWFEGIVRSAPTRAYRGAISDFRESHRQLQELLEPIRNHERIDWSRKCSICRPKKRWQFWR